MKKEGFEVYAFLRAANRLEHSGKNHLAIVQKLNLVAGDRQRIG